MTALTYPKPWVLASLAQPFTYGPNDNAEKVVFAATIPARYLVDSGLPAGDSKAVVIELALDGLVTTVGSVPTLDLRWRLGPTTLTGAQIAVHNDSNVPAADVAWRLFCANNMTNKTLSIRAQATVQPDGVSIWANGMMTSDATSGTSMTQGSGSAAAVAFDPTIDNLLEVTADWDDLAANIFKLTNASFTVLAPPVA